jgi:hypothetical protein
MSKPAGIQLLPFALSGGCLMLWIGLLARRSARRGIARGMLTITGYFRPRPDPWLEQAVRGALSEFDRELRKIMPRLYGDLSRNFLSPAA